MGEMSMRYKLYEQGPDDKSTYAECWGSTATSDGRLVAESSRLSDLAEAANSMSHSNWLIRDSHKRVWINPREFWSRPAVKAMGKAE
jgi:hypothetical protein